jgi:hypothetical protein
MSHGRKEANSDLITRQPFVYFYTAIDDSTDAGDTAQFLILLRSVNDKFDVVTELLSVDAMKGPIAEDFYKRVSTILERHKLY